jgi:hypothetical protein
MQIELQHFSSVDLLWLKVQNFSSCVQLSCKVSKKILTLAPSADRQVIHFPHNELYTNSVIFIIPIKFKKLF